MYAKTKLTLESKSTISEYTVYCNYFFLLKKHQHIVKLCLSHAIIQHLTLAW